MPIIRFEGPDGPESLELHRGENGLPRLMMSEIKHIQRTVDMTVPEMMEAMGRLDPDAICVVVQVLWKRQGRIVRFDEVDFDISTLHFELLPGEDDEDPEGLPEPDEVPPGAPDPTAASSGDATEAE